MSAWMTPKQVLKGQKFTVGQKLDPSKLGIQDHPQYGPLPILTVTSVKDDGSILVGTASCGCGQEIEVHAGDWFQKRRCSKCQKVAARHAAHPPMSEDEKAKLVSERAAKLEQKALEKAEAKAKRLAEAEERKALKIAKKAAEAQAAAEAKFMKAMGVK